MNHCCKHINLIRTTLHLLPTRLHQFQLVMFPYEMTFSKEPDTIRFVKFHRECFFACIAWRSPQKNQSTEMLEMVANGNVFGNLLQNLGGQDPPKLVEKHSSNKIWGENCDAKIAAVKLPFISFQRKGLNPETHETFRQAFHKKFTASHFTKPEFFRWSFGGSGIS